MRRFWTPEENKFFQQHYRKDMTSQQIADPLHRTKGSVRQHGASLDPKARRGPCHVWTEEERDYIRTHYEQTVESKRAIADHLKVSMAAVHGQLSYMGLVKVTDRQSWSAEEDERLAELLGQHCLRTVARLMHRSIASVAVRSKRLKLSRRDRDGWYTKSEVCEILGMGHKWVQRRIDRGELKASHHNGRLPSNEGLAMWHIEEKDLVKYICSHALELNGRNVDLATIVMLLKPKNGNGAAY